MENFRLPCTKFSFYDFFDLPPWPWKGDLESIKCIYLSCCKYLCWGSLLGWLVFLKLLGWFPCYSACFLIGPLRITVLKFPQGNTFFDRAVVKSLLLRDYTSVTSTGKHTVLQVKCLCCIFLSLTIKCYPALLNRSISVMWYLLLVSPINVNEKSITSVSFKQSPGSWEHLHPTQAVREDWHLSTAKQFHLKTLRHLASSGSPKSLSTWLDFGCS